VARIIRSDGELEEAAVHVRYEVNMLLFAVGVVGGCHSSPQSTPEENDRNVALDSFLLHFRNLRAFLCPKLQRVEADDILAGDFLKRPEFFDVADSDALAVDKKRIDKMLAHVSYNRTKYINDGDEVWMCARLASTMLANFDRFLAALPDHRTRWFASRAFLQEHRERFAAIAKQTEG
jgi:hypothetical protein